MGTHPIFESDFDCLTECQDMSRAKEMESLLPETALNAQLMADGSSTTGPSGVDPTQITKLIRSTQLVTGEFNELIKHQTHFLCFDLGADDKNRKRLSLFKRSRKAHRSEKSASLERWRDPAFPQLVFLQLNVIETYRA